MGQHGTVLVMTLLLASLCSSIPDPRKDIRNPHRDDSLEEENDCSRHEDFHVDQVEIMKAVDDGDIEGVKKLIEDDASATSTNAFIVAIANENEDMVNTLIEEGADVNAFEGLPLAIAASLGNKEIVRALLTADADPLYFEAAKAAAEKANNREIMRMLTENCGTEEGPSRSEMILPNEQLSLLVAVIRNDSKMVEEALSKGANPSEGLAFMIAILNENVDIINKLIAKGGDVNIMEGELLATAAGVGNTDVVRALIHGGAKPQHFERARFLAKKFGFDIIMQMLNGLLSQLIVTTLIPVGEK